MCTKAEFYIRNDKENDMVIEQHNILLACWTLGYRWLTGTVNGFISAWKYKPTKIISDECEPEVPYWIVPEGYSRGTCFTISLSDEISDKLRGLVYLDDEEPFDISKVLGLG